MKTNDTRLWNITVTWKHDGKSYKKEYVMTAPTKEKAEQAAVDRLLTPKNIPGASDEKYYVKDLGSIQEQHSYYSSEIMSAGLSASGRENRDLEQAVFRFAVMWGEEIGWREADQATSEADQTVLMKLKDNPDADTIVRGWAEEYLRGTASTAETFFKDKLTEYLGQEVLTVNDVLPVTDTEYSRIIRRANDEAARITADARKSADEMLGQMAAIAAALQSGTVSATHTKEILQDTPDIPPEETSVAEETAEPETEEEMPEIPETDIETEDIPEDAPEDIDDILEVPEEISIELEYVENYGDEKTEAPQNTENNENTVENAPDIEESEENAVSQPEESAEDLSETDDSEDESYDSEDQEDDDVDDYDKYADEDEDEEEMPENEQFILDDGPPDMNGFPEEPDDEDFSGEPDTDEDNDEENSDEENPADNTPSLRSLTDDAMREILKGYSPDTLEPLLPQLRVTTRCSRTGRTGTYDGQTFFMRMYGGSAPLDPEDRSAEYVDGVIAEAEEIDGKSALRWACEQCMKQTAANA